MSHKFDIIKPLLTRPYHLISDTEIINQKDVMRVCSECGLSEEAVKHFKWDCALLGLIYAKPCQKNCTCRICTNNRISQSIQPIVPTPLTKEQPFYLEDEIPKPIPPKQKEQNPRILDI